MKVNLSKEQKISLKAQVENNLTHKYFKAKDHMKFEIGDVLLKMIPGWREEGKLKPETNGSDTNMPQRYVYIFEDEFGVGYIKRLKVSDGQLGEETMCLLDFDHEHTKFMVDPEYAESTLLGNEFNIKDLHKQSLEAQKIITKMNRKSSIKPKTLKEINDFFAPLKKGAKFWLSQDYTGKHTKEHVIKSIKPLIIKDLDKSRDNYRWLNFKENDTANNRGQINDTLIYEIIYTTGWGDSTTCTYQLLNQVLTTAEPAKVDKK